MKYRNKFSLTDYGPRAQSPTNCPQCSGRLEHAVLMAVALENTFAVRAA